MTIKAHPTAIIEDGAEIDEGCTIGPHVIIESGAIIGADNEICAGAYIHGCVRMGSRNRLMRGTSLGGVPQDLGYRGEPTELIIGDDNWFGENTTVHRGTSATGKTVIGNHNYIMVNTHIGHDLRFGNHIITGPNVMIGGEAEVRDRANLGAAAGIHQMTRVGELVMVGAMARVVQDVVPFTMVANDGRLYGLNRIGIRRSDYPREHTPLLNTMYRDFCVKRKPLKAFLAGLREHPPNPFTEAWAAFLSVKSRRGYARSIGGEGEKAGTQPGQAAAESSSMTPVISPSQSRK